MARIVCIIPARGGSKGIPNKNILNIAGKPLIAWSIDQALATQSIAKNVYVTSDSKEILDIAMKHGAKPILRPQDISGDMASSESALSHALGEIAKSLDGPIDYVVFLQATSPVRAVDDIEKAITQIIESRADSLFSARKIKDFFVWKKNSESAYSHNFDFRNRKRRQDLEDLWLETGSIYIFRPEVLKIYDNRLGGKIVIHEMEQINSFQIDEPSDLHLCAAILRGLES